MQLHRTDGKQLQELLCEVLVRVEPVVKVRRTPRVIQTIFPEWTE